jgi:hypothetical protein
MKSASKYFFVIALLFVVLLNTPALAEEINLDSSKILAVVPVKNGNVDQSVYRQFDKIVPELKKISKSRILKLECRYSGEPNIEKDVENAYRLAAQIERYLRVQHKLELDLWVAVDIAPKTAKSLPVLKIAFFSEDIKKLDAVPVVPRTNEQ